MTKRYWIINLLCVCSLVGLVWKLRRDWRQYATHNGPQTVEVHALSGVRVPPALLAADYRAIVQQNPFHPERNDVIALPTEARVTGPPPLVYGSVIFGDTRFALLASEQSPKPQRVAEGAAFAGYRLVRVLPQSVVFESGAGRNEIMFYNSLERLHRQPSKTTASAKPASPPPVTSTGGAPPPSPDIAASVVPPAPTPPPSSSAASAGPAPAGTVWMDTPFGQIQVNKSKP